MLNKIWLKELFTFSLLPVFFVCHSYVESLGLVPLAIAAEVCIYYLLTISIVWVIFYKVFKSLPKATAFVIVLFISYFFFGSFHDFLKNATPDSFFSKYAFILPIVLLTYITAFILIKKISVSYQNKLTAFFRTLLLLWLFIDLVILLGKVGNKSDLLITPVKITAFKQKQKPDVFLIIADEYAGNDELNGLLHFDNTSFLTSLEARGFKIIKHARSNYDFTVYSTASILNMSYLNLKNKTNVKDVASSEAVINKSRVLRFFIDNGYEFYNYSIFRVENQPSLIDDAFNIKYNLITSQTLFSRIQKDLGYHFPNNPFVNKSERLYTYLHFNQAAYEKTLQTAKLENNKPKFVYTHL